MTDQTPSVKTYEQEIAAAGATVDTETDIVTAPFAGVVSKVSIISATAITGANTNTRDLIVVNKGPAGSGSTVVATLHLTSGNNTVADGPTTIPLSGTPANLVVAAGDVLVLQSTHASSGLADPGGLLHVELSRS